MKWITRERARVDRIACPWLISRFIDPKPEFLLRPGQPGARHGEARGAIPYDIPNVELGHHGPQCSFDAFVERYELADPALASARAHRPGRRYRRPRADAGVGRTVCGGDRLPGHEPGRLRQHGAPVPDVRRPLRVLSDAGRGAGAVPGAVRVSPRGGQERHRGGALPPSRRGTGSRDGRGGRWYRARRGAGAGRGEGARRRRTRVRPRAVRGPSRSTTWPARRASSASAATSRRRRASGWTSGRCPPSVTATRPRATASWPTSSAWSRSSRRDADVPLRHRGFIELPAAREARRLRPCRRPRAHGSDLRGAHRERRRRRHRYRGAEVRRLHREPAGASRARSSRLNRISSSRRTEERTRWPCSAWTTVPRSTGSESAFGRMVWHMIRDAGDSSSRMWATRPFRVRRRCRSWTSTRGSGSSTCPSPAERGGPSTIPSRTCFTSTSRILRRSSSSRPSDPAQHPARRPDCPRRSPRPGHRYRPASTVLCLRRRGLARDRCRQRHDSRDRDDRRGPRRRVPRCRPGPPVRGDR